ncbi:MAG: FAD:protein FMN transferase [Planctomycetes bacterium]|nr:FAD:protein FMN transferase [Planctomycetota bacterium]
MTVLAALCLLAGGIPAAPPDESAPARFEYSGVEMAVPVKMVLYAADEATAAAAADAAFARIRQLNGILSDYDPESELRRLCDSGGTGEAVGVGEELWYVLTRAQDLSQRSEGAFDVTVGPVVRLWRRARRRHEMPSAERLEAARELVGHGLVRLDPKQRAVELAKPGMRLDLGGIAKGYAADEALAVLRERGVGRALIDAGGDIRLGDPPPNKRGWLIGVAPLERDARPSRYLWLSGVAIATSGDTWQYVEIDGQRYSHLVDPRTGLGLTDHSSVTVIAPNCITADSLASAASVLGPERGLKLIDDIPDAAALIVRAPEGAVEVHESCRWKRQPVAEPGAGR